jgi:hypothetical protein
MAFGLEIYNSSGNVVINNDSSLSAFATSGVITVSAGSTTAPISVPGMSNNGLWSVILFYDNGSVPQYVSITISNNSFTLTEQLGFADQTLNYLVVRLS